MNFHRQLDVLDTPRLAMLLSKRQRALYEEYMASGATRATLASGNFLGIMNCLMQLRKVRCGWVLYVRRCMGVDEMLTGSRRLSSLRCGGAPPSAPLHHSLLPPVATAALSSRRSPGVQPPRPLRGAAHRQRPGPAGKRGRHPVAQLM